MIWAQLSSPYPVSVIDGCVSSIKFPDHLIRHFPYPGGTKSNFNQSHPEWDEWVQSDPWMRDFVLALPALSKYLSSSLGGVNVAPFSPKVELSVLENGGGLLPHPDTARKAMTAVLYLADPDWDPAWGGNFEVVRAKHRPDRDFTGMNVPWDEVETVLSVPFVPERLCVMARTQNSLHGVRPLACPFGRRRRSITVNWMRL